MIAAWIDAPGYEAANAEMRRYVAEDLDRVTVPTTIVWGELDRLVAPPRPERRPPGSRYLQFGDLGHTPNWDDPELVARLLLEASSPGRRPEAQSPWAGRPSRLRAPRSRWCSR